MSRIEVDLATEAHTRRFQEDVITGLAATPKVLPSKYLYDQRGSELFDRICELDEYYPTRTELSILREHAPAMAEAIGPRVLLIEPGSGASVKVRHLLDHLDRPAGYVPVEISGEHMAEWLASLAADYPDLPLRPVHADFTRPFTVPRAREARRRVIYFPGSTIGNFKADDAVPWLARMGDVAQEGGGLLIGVDLKKDRRTLEAAYNDAEGVTAEFNLNLLHRINRELDADVDVEGFEHRAFYNDDRDRIEMHLVSQEAQTVRVDDAEFEFDPGETIHTESSHKYDLEQFRRLAADAGWSPVDYWTDDRELFSVQLFKRRAG